MISTPQIAWVAGLLEAGASSFTIRIKMTDFDVVGRAAALLGGKLYASKEPRSHWKPTWVTQVKGSTAAGWAMTLYPWFGVIGPCLAGAIGAYRTARVSQAEIMAILKVSKSTVYRHTNDTVGRMRVTARHDRPSQIRECRRSYRHRHLGGEQTVGSAIRSALVR